MRVYMMGRDSIRAFDGTGKVHLPSDLEWMLRNIHISKTIHISKSIDISNRIYIIYICRMGYKDSIYV